MENPTATLQPRSFLRSRREFLKSTTIVAGSLAGESLGTGASPAALPTTSLGPYQVSRLVAGSNPINGISHFNRLLDRHMLEYFTEERIVQFLLDCEKAGINTWQSSFQKHVPGAYQRMREAGCKIHWICLAASWHADPSLPRTPEGILAGMLKAAEIVAPLKPIGIAHHGGATDQLWRAGKMDYLRTFINKVHDLGFLACVSLHNPLVLEALEEKGFPADFYMASLYYLTREPEDLKKELGTVPLGEVYLPEDPERMCRTVRQVQKPCLVFKVFAAGRNCDSTDEVRGALTYAYQNVKPKDAIIVGMYPRFSDQITVNVRLTKEILGGEEN
jgi:hypothetical protein